MAPHVGLSRPVAPGLPRVTRSRPAGARARAGLLTLPAPLWYCTRSPIDNSEFLSQ
eukprot:COSAG02_NODE_1567_length_11900_cov_6.050250_10_plen_56_part_00